METKLIELKDIFADGKNFNCRGDFDYRDIYELANSIKEKGLIQPVMVVPSANVDYFKTDKPYSLIAGFRRYKAHEYLALKQITCVVNDNIKTTSQAMLVNLLENVARKELTILQEAKALSRLRALGVNRDDAARETGKSPGWVQLRYMILDLPEDVQEVINKNILNTTDIRTLHSTMINIGVSEMYTVLKKIKTAKAMGHKSARLNLIKKDQKKARSKSEIQMLLTFLYDNYDVGLHTRTLAWAAGNISNEELDEDLKDYAAELGKPFLSIMEMA